MSLASVATLAYTAEAMNLGGLFSGTRCYTIPMFQRSYSWTSIEVGQLISDLWLGVEEARERAGQYGGFFIGSLVVVDGTDAARSSNGLKVFEVIDGKQRLTTLTILLAALRDRLGDRTPWIDGLLSHDDAHGFDGDAPARLMLGNEEGPYFGRQVFRRGATLADAEPSNEGQERCCIRECQLTIVEDLDDHNDDELAELAEFLRDKVALALISAPDIDTGFRVFVTTNHRGKLLTATDILKAELMAALPEGQRQQALEHWRSLEKELGSDFAQLPSYLRMVHGSRHGATIREVLQLVHRHGGALRFLDDLLFPLASSMYPILNAAHSGSPHSERINRSLRLLNWLKGRDWVAPALAFTYRFPGRDADFTVFLEALERLAYGMLIAGTSGARRIARYREVIEGLAGDMPIDGSSGPLALDLEEQDKLLLNATGGLYDRNSTTCRLLLKRISASYDGDQAVEPISDVTIEHVLPTNPPDNSPWRKEIADPVERLACNKLLGNLVLVSKQQNKDAGNLGLDAKLRVFFPDGCPSPHAITNHLIGTRTWNAADIRGREDLLVKRIKRIWNISDKVRPSRRRSSKLN